MIKKFIVIVLLSIPVLLFYLNKAHPEVEGQLLFSLFALGAMIERIWETFFTSKEKDVRKYQGDWTLPATSFAFFITSLLLIFAFYDTPTKNVYFVAMGLLFFVSAGVLRWWSVKSLGDYWSIHLVEDKLNVKQPSIIKKGPYGYIRHPIYLGAVLELIGIALIVNAFHYLLLIGFFNVPLYVLRAKYEEKINITKFGDKYLAYKREVPFMIPWKILKT